MVDKFKGVIYDSKFKHSDELVAFLKHHTITHFKHDGFNSKYCIQEEGLKAIAPFLFTKRLVYLDLSFNELNDSATQIIVEGLKHCPALTNLILKLNPFTTVGLSSIVDAILHNNLSNLHLNLRNLVDVTDFSPIGKLISSTCLSSLLISNLPGLEPVFQALKANSTLKELEVYSGLVVDECDYSQLVDDCFEENATIIKGFGPCGITRHIIINELCKELNASESDRRSVPKQLQTREEIKKYLKELMRTGTQMNTLKLAILGHGEIGKTTLLNSIRAVQEEMANKQKPFFLRIFQPETKSEVKQPPRTVGIDQSILRVKGGELAVWDFGGQLEYAVTHQFFLSNELVVYVVCYDLSQPPDVQMQQLSYWLDFLSSALSLPDSPSPYSQSKWRIIIVGTKLDKSTVDPSEQLDSIECWRAKWPKLPIHPTPFFVSSHSSKGITELLSAIEVVSSSIFERHTLRIPVPFKSLLESLQAIPEDQSFTTITSLAQKYPHGMDSSLFAIALKYLHAIGRIVLLKKGLVCTAPQIIPKIAAKFISPAEVRFKLAANNRVEIMAREQIGAILKIRDDSERLSAEVRVLETIGVCFELSGKSPAYLFPSLSEKIDAAKFLIAGPYLPLAAIRFSAPQGTIFVPGFFCQLVVGLFEKLNSELIAVHGNCVSVSCSGIFVGELLVTIEDDAKSIVALMRATNPDLSIVRNVFYQTTRTHASQYQSSLCHILCPTCVDLSYFSSPPQFTHAEIGTVDFKSNATVDEDESSEVVLFCKPRVHVIENYGKPQRPNKMVKQPSILNTTLCWTHNRTKHHFFVSYRVVTEGRKSCSISSENEFGLVEVIYHLFATTKKNGKPIYVFWDKKCLTYGQNWERGFVHGLKSSKVILLLVSQKVIEGIAKNAPDRQDNVLVEYPRIKIRFSNILNVDYAPNTNVPFSRTSLTALQCFLYSQRRWLKTAHSRGLK